MIRVTKAEVKEALGEREMTKEYCICRNCHYAFRITDEERKEYQDLRCGNCSTKYIYYAGYDVGLVDSIIDPEPTQPQEQYYIIIADDNRIHNTPEEANKRADELAAGNQGEKITVVKDVIKDACQFQLDADQLVVNNLEAENGKLQERIKELEALLPTKEDIRLIKTVLENESMRRYGNVKKDAPIFIRLAKLQAIIDKRGCNED